MCVYSPYAYSCGHGTISHPAFHLLDPCFEYHRLIMGQHCPRSQYVGALVDTGFACWDCHSSQFKRMGREPNIWVYNVIVNKLGSGECTSLLRRDRIYYRALLCKVGPDGVPIETCSGEDEGVSTTSSEVEPTVARSQAGIPRIVVSKTIETGGRDVGEGPIKVGRVGAARARARAGGARVGNRRGLNMESMRWSPESEATIESNIVVRTKNVRYVHSSDGYEGDYEESWESDDPMSVDGEDAAVREENPAYRHTASPDRISTVFDKLLLADS